MLNVLSLKNIISGVMFVVIVVFALGYLKILYIHFAEYIGKLVVKLNLFWLKMEDELGLENNYKHSYNMTSHLKFTLYGVIVPDYLRFKKTILHLER